MVRLSERDRGYGKSSALRKLNLSDLATYFSRLVQIFDQ